MLNGHWFIFFCEVSGQIFYLYWTVGIHDIYYIPVLCWMYDLHIFSPRLWSMIYLFIFLKGVFFFFKFQVYKTMQWVSFWWAQIFPFMFIAFCVIFKNLIVSAFTFRSMIHRKLTFCVWCEVGDEIYLFLPYRYLVT